MLSYVTRTIGGLLEDDCPMMAAALAYYTVFSLPSLLLITISVSGLAFGRAAVSTAMSEQLQQWMAPGVSRQVEGVLENAASHHATGVLAIMLGTAALFFSATTAFAQLQNALNRIWHITPDPRIGGVRNFLGKRLLSFCLVVALGFLVLLLVSLNIAVEAFGGAVVQYVPGLPSARVLNILNLGTSFAVIAILFAAVFRYLPDSRLKWRDVVPGAVLTAVLFVAGKYGLGFYFGHANPGSSYGAAGSVILVLLWTYYSSVLVFLGAEFTKIWAEKHERRIVPRLGAVKVVHEEHIATGREGRRAA